MNASSFHPDHRNDQNNGRCEFKIGVRDLNISKREQLDVVHLKADILDII